MSKLRVYNSLTRKKDEFKPINVENIGVYSCGPTVYNFVHIGNLCAYIFDDILVRVLRYNYGNAQVKWVMNITDVDDKTINGAKLKYPDLEPKIALAKFTEEYTGYLFEDLAGLNILPQDINPRATDEKYILAMKDLIKNIYEAGFAYIKDGSVYFNVVDYSQKYKYGQLVNLDVSKLKSGLRIDTDNYDKDDLQDFVLWKGEKPGEPVWDFELNGESLPGRPGWHIECSAMSQSSLGCPFDIHAGGGDLKFPHHEDEIAQSTVGYGAKQPVNYWLHNGMLMVEGKKMSKSLQNFYTLKDIKDKGINPLAFRYFNLLAHYRKPLNFTWEALAAAESGLESIYRQLNNLGMEIGLIDLDFQENFCECVSDDFNTPKALAVMQEVLKSEMRDQDKLATLLDFDRVLGLEFQEVINAKEDITVEVQQLKIERDMARVNKDWAESDRLREQIEKSGYLVEDTKEGSKIIKK